MSSRQLGKKSSIQQQRLILGGIITFVVAHIIHSNQSNFAQYQYQNDNHNYDFCNDQKDEPTTIYIGAEPENPFDGCFVTSVFGISVEHSDRIVDVTELRTKYTNYEFIMFTNLVDLDAEFKSWRKVLHLDTRKTRMITQSRYPKFLAWKETFIQKYCPVVFYMDATLTPSGSLDEFTQLKDQLLQFEEGLSQRPHGNTFEKELNAIVRYGKDTREHTDLTREWVHSQPDYRLWNQSAHVYLNRFFGEEISSLLFLLPLHI
jgi:hypothetical protein